MLEIIRDSAELRRLCYFAGFIVLVYAIPPILNAIAALVK